jgi:hypothetical protein
MGLAFACAVVWKVALSPDFLGGRFFRVTLMTDPRLVTAAELVGGLSDEEIAANHAFAPVAGFGWLLLVMGAAQVQADQIWLRRLYVAMFLVVLFYTEVPWAGIVLDMGKG